jgi:8-oxo-dGTP pyrophosphatase MutT (NUDIX family)
MPHIHTLPGQHDHTISIYIIRTDFSEPKIMLHLHRKAHIYAQFGGHIELNETPWQSAVHELREESGYDLDQLHILQPTKRLTHVSDAVVHPVPAVHATMGYMNDDKHFHTDSAYVALGDQEPHHNPAEGESSDIRLFTRNELASSPEIDGVTRDIALYALDECLPNWIKVLATEFHV